MIKIRQNKDGSRTAKCECGNLLHLKGQTKRPFSCPFCGSYYNPFGYPLEPETVQYIKTHPDYYYGG